MPTLQPKIATKIMIQGIFATPVAVLSLPEASATNSVLKKLILKRSASNPSTNHSNRGGWQSTWDFHKWCGKEGRKVIATARHMANQLTCDLNGKEVNPDWKLNSWANVNRRDNGNEFHFHPGSFWSGTYYVEVGGASNDPTLGGEFEIQDPRGPATTMYAPTLVPKVPGGLSTGASELIVPIPGMIILFPAWLSHSVRPYNGNDMRISVAFNLSF